MARTRGARGDPRIAVAYLRVSTDKQQLGPDAQKLALERWAATHGVEIAAWHTDVDVSGGSELHDRPGLLAAIANLRANGAGLLAIAKRDRLARSVEIAVALEREVSRAGAAVVSADGHNDGGPNDRLIRQIQDALAEHERALIGARTRDALAVKRARGQLTSHPPFGFRRALASAGGPRSRTGRVLALEPDPREQKVCTLVMRLHDKGYSERAIEDELRWKVKNRAGRCINDTTIHRIITQCAALRSVFPNHAQGDAPILVSCARGHTYDRSWEGRYCVREECRRGRGNGSPDRQLRIR